MSMVTPIEVSPVPQVRSLCSRLVFVRVKLCIFSETKLASKTHTHHTLSTHVYLCICTRVVVDGWSCASLSTFVHVCVNKLLQYVSNGTPVYDCLQSNVPAFHACVDLAVCCFTYCTYYGQFACCTLCSFCSHILVLRSHLFCTLLKRSFFSWLAVQHFICSIPSCSLSLNGLPMYGLYL